MAIQLFDADHQEIVFEPDLFPSDGFSNQWQTFRGRPNDASFLYRWRHTSQTDCYVIQLSAPAATTWFIHLPYFDCLLLFHFIQPCELTFGDSDPSVFHDRAGRVLDDYASPITLRMLETGAALLIAIPLPAPFVAQLDLSETQSAHNQRSERHFIIDRALLQLLSDLLFHESLPGTSHFLLEELMRVLIRLSFDHRVHGPFQPNNITAHEGGWFQSTKNQLLSVIHRPLPVGELVKLSGLPNIKAFRYLLKSFYGLSIAQLVLEARMTEAQSLLKGNDWTIKQVAAKTGFKNVYYFSRMFHRYTGMPPGQYQQVFGSK